MAEKKTDPAAKVREEKDKQENVAGVKEFDPGNISSLTFETISQKKARMPHPFEGYPYPEKIQVGVDAKKKPLMICPTYLISLNPANVPNEDASGRGMVIQKIDAKGKPIEGSTFVADLGTYHSRVLRCYEPPYSGDNYDVVFDRYFETDQGLRVFYAVVPYHSLRAQLMYWTDWKKDPPLHLADQRYAFADAGQAARLRDLYLKIISPKIKVEQMSEMISGGTDASEAQLNTIQTEV
jgi:hypothetical protein